MEVLLTITRRFISPIYPPVSAFGNIEIKHACHPDFQSASALPTPHGHVRLGDEPCDIAECCIIWHALPSLR